MSVRFQLPSELSIGTALAAATLAEMAKTVVKRAVTCGTCFENRPRITEGRSTFETAMASPATVVPITSEVKPNQPRRPMARVSSARSQNSARSKPSLLARAGPANAPMPNEKTGMAVRKPCCARDSPKSSSISGSNGPTAAKGGRSTREYINTAASASQDAKRLVKVLDP